MGNSNIKKTSYRRIICDIDLNTNKVSIIFFNCNNQKHIINKSLSNFIYKQTIIDDQLHYNFSITRYETFESILDSIGRQLNTNITNKFFYDNVVNIRKTSLI